MSPAIARRKDMTPYWQAVYALGDSLVALVGPQHPVVVITEDEEDQHWQESSDLFSVLKAGVAFRRDYGVRGDRYRILLTYGFTYRDVEESDIQGAPTFDIAILPRRNRG